MLWRKLEIVVAFIALAFFAFHDYERADFLMLSRYAPALAHAPILFREDGDTRHDMVVKPELLEAYMKENYKKPPFAVFEDRNSMVAKWRELGYTCFQPAEGNF